MNHVDHEQLYVPFFLDLDHSVPFNGRLVWSWRCELRTSLRNSRHGIEGTHLSREVWVTIFPRANDNTHDHSYTANIDRNTQYFAYHRLCTYIDLVLNFDVSETLTLLTLPQPYQSHYKMHTEHRNHGFGRLHKHRRRLCGLSRDCEAIRWLCWRIRQEK
jgi:hypothetical protein